MVVAKAVDGERRPRDIPASGEKSKPKELRHVGNGDFRVVFRTRTESHLYLSDPLPVDKSHESRFLGCDGARLAAVAEIEDKFLQ